MGKKYDSCCESLELGKAAPLSLHPELEHLAAMAARQLHLPSKVEPEPEFEPEAATDATLTSSLLPCSTQFEDITRMALRIRRGCCFFAAMF